MTENDPFATRRGPIPDAAGDADADSDTVSSLAVAGFTDAEQIGRGGFGVVYRCRQDSLDRTVAVKVLSASLDPDNLERFLREQRAMGRLSGHPHIVTVLQSGTTDTGLPYLVMHYHPHDSLEVRIRRHGPLPWPEAVSIAIKVAGALETAHRSGVLHRDVKPGNILITEYGEPQLTDFGIARIADGFQTSSDVITGSPAFTAPEILRGKNPTAAADVYGLAATLFCSITGHAAYERQEGERMVAQFLRITSQPVPDLRGEGIPDDVCKAMEQGMATDPSDRPQSAAEFGEMLRRIERAHDVSVDEMALPDPSVTDLAPTGAAPRELSQSHSFESTAFTSPSTAPATRFRPPAPARRLVDRARLINLLRTGQRRRLTAIHAPTGFGKSTLASQWRDVLTAEGVPVAWLAVDSDDNNVLWFLAHLIEAMKQVRPQLAGQLRRILETHGDDAERYVLSTLIDELHTGGVATTLVIDDWHLVTSEKTIAALEFLLDRGCHHLQIVVTGRNRAGLPISRMRVRDELVEIDSTALRFDVDESDAFLRDIGGLGLNSEEVENLTQVTEGWAAALQLASLSLRDADNPADLIGHLSGRHHAIGEFLADNVLHTLEPEMYEFLLLTSIPDEISGGLASALTGNPRAQAMLEEAENRDLFLRHADDEYIWFRYQHMFQDFLRRRLERDHPDRIADLHHRAAEWFAKHHMLSEAVDHALAAGDEEFAVDVLAEDGMRLMEHSHMATLLALIDKLPRSAVVRNPRLQLIAAWACVPLQYLERASKLIDGVRNTLATSDLPTYEIADLRLEADVIEAAIAIYCDHIGRIDELVAPCFEKPDELSPWVVTAATNFATYADIYHFEFDRARRRQEWAEPYFRSTHGPFAEVYGHCLAGIAAGEQLDVAAAEKSFRTALQLARKSSKSHSHVARLAAAVLGELLYEQGRLTEAEALLDESHKLGPAGGVPDFMIARYAAAARLKMVHGERDAAIALLDEGMEAAHRYDLPRLRARIRNEQARMELPLAEVPDRTMPDSDEPGADGIAEVTAQIEDATVIRLMYRSGDPDAAARAVAWARLWHRRTASNGRHRAHLQATRLLTACLYVAGRMEEAERVLADAVEMCGARGMLRYLVDGGSYVVAVLEMLQARLQEERWPDDWPVIDAAFLAEMLRLAECGQTSTRL
ncbi:protein kinase domain-containing protein [Rhodococcus chondri]|uniref:Serine/threonine-protein kinase PknK n=1 Tax=Rhodococcus chondri TaxID=3065941 RepID=A0ABU7JQ69_9NOCA|nr:protein kinase [Rhodococcus sp. CC-R104]MEE2031897.1 protein kinase [Rhodococcus sp. CC-R104]